MDDCECFSSSTPEHLTSHLRKSPGLIPQKRKASGRHKAFQLCAHLLWAVVHTTVIYQPPWHSGRPCYWWVWGILHVRFYTFHIQDLSWLALLWLCHWLTTAHDHFFPCLDTFFWHWDKEVTETCIPLPTAPCTPLTGKVHISCYHFSNADSFQNCAINGVGVLLQKMSEWYVFGSNGYSVSSAFRDSLAWSLHC